VVRILLLRMPYSHAIQNTAQTIKPAKMHAAFLLRGIFNHKSKQESLTSTFDAHLPTTLDGFDKHHITTNENINPRATRVTSYQIISVPCLGPVSALD